MQTIEPNLAGVLDAAFGSLHERLNDQHPGLVAQETGVIQSVSMGTATVAGLPGVGFEELLEFPGGVPGFVFNLDPEGLGVVLLGDSEHLKAGMEVRRTGRVMDVPVGDGLLGRVIDAKASPLDESGPLCFQERLPIERPAPPIMHRAPVTVPLQTGIKVIDALIPIGRGQRELIVGDRQTGKTAVALDTMLNQRGNGVVCVYCAIGQRGDSVARVISVLREHAVLDQSVVIVAGGETPPGLKYVAPYAATSIAEHFMAAGRDVLIVYDDLSQHARAYRELSLLLHRPPGREAFPGDIFYIHARLLERSTHLRPEFGGGSLTALPIVETEAQNISAYIPTNLISITDGQLYLSPALFQTGNLPAVDVGKSVSRVGGKAQLPAFRAVAGDLKLAYSQFEELELFSRFGTRLDDATRQTLAHGRAIRECLRQAESDPYSVPEQITVLLALASGLFDALESNRMKPADRALREAVGLMPTAIRERMLQGQPFSAEDKQVVQSLAEAALRPFRKDRHDRDPRQPAT